MKYKNDEYLFKGYSEAMTHHDILKDSGIVLYTCAKCGIHFGSADPYTSDYGIICRVCVKTMNLSEINNYRPDADYFEDEEY